MCFLGICCSCGNKTITKLDITNKIQTAITDSNKIINDVLNQTINDVSTELINNVSSSINIDTGSYNSFTAQDIDVSGSTFDVNQLSKTDAQNIAMNQIASDQQSIDDLTNNIIAKLQDKATSNTDLNTAMNTLDQIKQITDTAGGPEEIVNNIASALQNTISGGGDSKDDEKNFMNSIGITVDHTNEFKNNINTIVQTSVSGKITSNTFGNVNIGNASSNTTVVRNVTITQKNGIPGHVNITQDATLESFTKAIMSLQLGSGISNKILGDYKMDQLTDALNTTKEAVKNDGTAIVVDKTIQKSAIMDFLNNLNPLNLLKSFGVYGTIIIVVIVILVALFVFVFIIPHLFKKSSTTATIKQ